MAKLRREVTRKRNTSHIPKNKHFEENFQYSTLDLKRTVISYLDMFTRISFFHGGRGPEILHSRTEY